jgi:thiol:disulfide interchange protein DsbC
MLSKSILKSLVIASLLVIAPAQATEIPKEVAELVQNLGVSVENVRSTPANGLYELQAGNQIFYITQDGKYLLTGQMLDMATKENLTDTRMKGIRLDAINTVSADKLISFKASNQKYQVTVFTDIDCGYCRKLHSEMDGYNKLGISINYLFFPRTGMGTESYNKAVSVWCNEDRHTAMNKAKAGQSLPEKKCNNPVAAHYQLGSEMGLTGTPYILTEHGDALPGYLAPAALKLELDKSAAMAVQSVKKEVSKR